MHYPPRKKLCFKPNLSVSVSSIQYSTVGVANSAQIRWLSTNKASACYILFQEFRMQLYNSKSREHNTI